MPARLVALLTTCGVLACLALARAVPSAAVPTPATAAPEQHQAQGREGTVTLPTSDEKQQVLICIYERETADMNCVDYFAYEKWRKARSKAPFNSTPQVY